MLLLLACTAVANAAETPYLAYSYQGIDVIAPGEGASARTLAHNIHRLEAAARKLLDWDSGAPLPSGAAIVVCRPAQWTSIVVTLYAGSVRVRDEPLTAVCPIARGVTGFCPCAVAAVI
jgi:hypothetical protein